MPDPSSVEFAQLRGHTPYATVPGPVAHSVRPNRETGVLPGGQDPSALICYGVIVMVIGARPTFTGGRGVSVAIRIGVTVPAPESAT